MADRVPGPDEGKWLRTKRGRVRHHIDRHFVSANGCDNRRVSTCGQDVFLDRRVMDWEPDPVVEAASDYYPKCVHCLGRLAQREAADG